VVGKSHTIDSWPARNLPGQCWLPICGCLRGYMLDIVLCTLLRPADCSVSVTRLPDRSLGAFFPPLSRSLFCRRPLSELARRLIQCLALAILGRKCRPRREKVHAEMCKSPHNSGDERARPCRQTLNPCSSHVTELSPVYVVCASASLQFCTQIVFFCVRLILCEV
jgi:hypothetical protein